MQPQHVTHFLEDFLGSSWRTKLLGLILIFLGAPLVAIGGVFSIWESTREAGVIFISQGVIMLTTGVGFFLTRDHAASTAKAAELTQQIVAGEVEHYQNTQKIASLDAKVEQVPVVVAEAVKPVVAEVVEQVKPKIAQEIRQEIQHEQRRGLR